MLSCALGSTAFSKLWVSQPPRHWGGKKEGGECKNASQCPSELVGLGSRHCNLAPSAWGRRATHWNLTTCPTLWGEPNQTWVVLQYNPMHQGSGHNAQNRELNSASPHGGRSHYCTMSAGQALSAITATTRPPPPTFFMLLIFKPPTSQLPGGCINRGKPKGDCGMRAGNHRCSTSEIL